MADFPCSEEDWPASEEEAGHGFCALARALGHAAVLADGRVRAANNHADSLDKMVTSGAELLQDAWASRDSLAEAGAADMTRVVELEAELERAKGREEGLQYALQRAYGCKCMKL